MPFEEQHDLLYRAVCATNNYTEDYVGKTARSIVENAKDRNGRDQHSHLVKHAIEKNRLPVVKGDFNIPDTSYRNKYSCNGPPVFKSGSCRLKFS